MIKKLSIAGLITIGLMLLPASIYAQATGKTASSPAQIKKEQISLQKISTLKTKADNEISRRLTSLNSLVTKIGGLQKLSADQKSQLTSQIQANITELTNLKARVDSATDLTVLKADVKAVVANYKIYALFMPKINELLAIDRVSILADKLSTIYTTLQNKNGDKALLTDMLNKITDAKSMLSAAETEVVSLAPEGYPGNVSTLKDARTKIKTAGSDLKAANQDAQKIRQSIKTMAKPSTATPSAK